jgi:hypothetical protein
MKATVCQGLRPRRICSMYGKIDSTSIPNCNSPAETKVTLAIYDLIQKSLELTELIHLCNGRLTWEPDPDALDDCVRIGHVGYFQRYNFC